MTSLKIDIGYEKTITMKSYSTQGIFSFLKSRASNNIPTIQEGSHTKYEKNPE